MSWTEDPMLREMFKGIYTDPKDCSHEKAFTVTRRDGTTVWSCPTCASIEPVKE